MPSAYPDDPGDLTDLGEGWPALPAPADWDETYSNLHMWSQVVGKIRLKLGPWINHSWGVPLYVTTRGLTTSPIPYRGRSFAIDFDFVDPALRITTSEGDGRTFALAPMTVADFYRRTVDALGELGIEAAIFTRPVEIEDAIRFEDDDRFVAYDAEAARRVWGALVHCHRVFTAFRARFTGKVSPVHFFWGSFDLAVTRFSGRTAPEHPGGAPNCADWVMKEAYSHEVSSAGFWPGRGLGEPAFYAYAYPAPEGFEAAPVGPAGAYFHQDLGEFLLPYEALRTAPDPDAALTEFLQTTYAAAADLGGWDRKALEREPGDRYVRP